MTELNCHLATEADLAALCQFYQDICAHQKEDQFGADWHWGIYPLLKKTSRKPLTKNGPWSASRTARLPQLAS